MFLVFDLPIFNLFYNLVGKSVCLDAVAIFLAQDLIYFLPFLAGLVYFFRRNKSFLKIVLLGLVCLAIIFIIDFFFKRFHLRSRPFVFLEFSPLIDFSPKEASFPSLHTALSFAIALIVYFLNKKWGIIFLVLAFLIGLSRIYVGVHWPSDIIAGFFLALLSFILSKYFLKKMIFN